MAARSGVHLKQPIVSVLVTIEVADAYRCTH